LAVCTNFRMIFIILIFGNVPDILLLHYSRGELQLPLEKREVSSLGLELQVSVSAFMTKSRFRSRLEI